MTFIATRNPERRATLSARYEVPRSVSTADEVLQLDDIDLVSIHVPDHLHAALTLAALAAVKHFFVEKPLGTNVEEITTVIDVAVHLPVRERAIAEHRSQPSPYEGLPNDLYRAFLERVYLHRAGPGLSAHTDPFA